MDIEKLQSTFDLTGRTAIVTGGTRGIGRSVAEALACAGANVVVASRKAVACAEAASHINTLGGGEALGVPTHMGDPAATDDLVAATVGRFGGIDILINNAANGLAEPVGQFTADGWQKSFEVNLRGPVLLSQAALPHLEQSDHASIVNVISVGAFLFSGGMAIYSSMKAGLLAVTRSLAADLVGRGIRVNALAPGTVDTDMVRNNSKEAQARMAAASLMKRAAHADEMAGPVLFLASDASSFMTGQVLVVDGGMHPH